MLFDLFLFPEIRFVGLLQKHEGLKYLHCPRSSVFTYLQQKYGYPWLRKGEHFHPKYIGVSISGKASLCWSYHNHKKI